MACLVALFRDRSERMMYQPDYDVTVVGAGPAGSRTAEALAQRGFHVALLEKGKVVGEPVHCTGIVSDECFQRYNLPDSLVIRPITSFVLRSPSGRPAHVARKNKQAHVLDRVALDRLLADRAVSAGAELMKTFSVDDVTWMGDHVEVQGTHEGHPAGLTSRAAVIATGYGSKLPRRAGLGGASDYASGCQAVVETEIFDDIQVFTGGALGDGGFGWLVPWKPGLALTGLITRRDTMSYLRAHVTKLQDSGQVGAVRELFRCRGIPLGITQRSVADGVLGVGDAVGQVKPTSGGGIYFGLLGAEEAAGTLAESLAAGDVSAASLAPYEHRWRALLGAEIHQGYALRQLIEQLPDPVVEQMHRLLTVPGLRRLLVAAAPSFDWHSGPLTSLLARLSRQSKSAQPSIN